VEEVRSGSSIQELGRSVNWYLVGVVAQLVVAALYERRNRYRIKNGGHRPPLQHPTDPFPNPC